MVLKRMRPVNIRGTDEVQCSRTSHEQEYIRVPHSKHIQTMPLLACLSGFRCSKGKSYCVAAADINTGSSCSVFTPLKFKTWEKAGVCANGFSSCLSHVTSCIGHVCVFQLQLSGVIEVSHAYQIVALRLLLYLISGFIWCPMGRNVPLLGA